MLNPEEDSIFEFYGFGIKALSKGPKSVGPI